MDTHENQLEKGVLFLFGKRFVNGVSPGKKLLIFMDTHYSLVSVGSLGKSIIVHIFQLSYIGKLGKIIQER